MLFSEYLLELARAKHFAVSDIYLSQPRELERKRHKGLEHEAHTHTAPGRLSGLELRDRQQGCCSYSGSGLGGGGTDNVAEGTMALVLG